MTVDRSSEEANDQFPVGMRVLAVDDDPICLKLLETLLRKCRYHVTTTNQAIKALKLLRENKNKFDLVISDVHMPDMDGFKLLELVGLEMDLPVIMLSANGDTKLVMKGITHGACDYLLKPVRIEELKNIWQHVVRRKKIQSMDKFNSDKPYNENEGGRALAVSGDSDQNVKLNRKRKDQKEDDDDRETGPNNEESTSQKKPRVVWTVDLHRKFVAAVRTLGVEKAVPKKILDMMNVEKLSRENVASHLQKYRQYLKRISCVANQQANMVAAFGGPDSAYMQMTTLNGFGNLQNGAVRPFSSSGILGSRLNTPSGLPMNTLSSSQTIQLGRAQNMKNSINNQLKFQPVIMPRNQNSNMLQVMPTSVEFDQHDKGGINNSDPLPISSARTSGFANSGNINQPCGTVTLSNGDFPSELPDSGRCTDNWSAVQPNSFASSDCLKEAIPVDRVNNTFQTHVNSCDIPSFNGIFDLRADISQKLGYENLGTYSNSNLVCNSVNSMIPSDGVLGPLTAYSNRLDFKDTGFCNSNDFNAVDTQSFVDPLIVPHNDVNQTALQTTVKLKQSHLGQTNLLDSYSCSDSGSLEDLVSTMMKLDQDMLM